MPATLDNEANGVGRMEEGEPCDSPGLHFVRQPVPSPPQESGNCLGLERTSGGRLSHMCLPAACAVI